MEYWNISISISISNHQHCISDIYFTFIIYF